VAVPYTFAKRLASGIATIVVKFKTFRIKFKKVQEKMKFVEVRKSSKAALMSVSQSSSSSED